MACPNGISCSCCPKPIIKDDPAIALSMLGIILGLFAMPFAAMFIAGLGIAATAEPLERYILSGYIATFSAITLPLGVCGLIRSLKKHSK